jgi:hypothetical protein
LKPRLYLETTIPSYLVARRSRDLRLAADQESTQEWWEQKRHGFEIFISQVVITEVSRGDSTFAAARLDKLRDISVLVPTPAGEQLAERLLAEGILPAIAVADATHLGFSAANGMDYLLTWNCRHINNPALRRQIERTCTMCGLTCPIICTPTELMSLE